MQDTGTMGNSPTVVWTPSDPNKSDSALAKLLRSRGLGLDDFEALHRWSVAEPGQFWRELWRVTGVVGEPGSTSVIIDPNAPMTGTRFFPEATLNFAENVFRHHRQGPAVVEVDETGASRTTTWNSLAQRVARFAAGLRSAGVQPGDRVAAVLPNGVECLVTLLATAAVGAVWTSCSPDFGAEAIIGRLGQVEPKVLICAPTYRYAGKVHNISERVKRVAAALPGQVHLVLVGDSDAEDRDATPFDTFGEPAPLEFSRVGFNDPLYVLYTSGTTGAPKAIVHGVGGTLLQQVKEHVLHGDVKAGDRMLWYTNTAWMMYHWMVAALAAGAEVVLFDGAPIHKRDGGLDCSPLWAAAESHGVTHLGVSPKYLATVADAGYRPGAQHDLTRLRWLMSAGAPVAPQQFDWIYDAVGLDIGFASISGGTEIMGCFLLGSPLHPVRRGELTVKGLGMAVEVFDEQGNPTVGQPGDLVCTQPFPSMPLCFWGADGLQRYHDSYFSQRPEIWTHGDYAEMRSSGGAVIFGRTDSTLNPGGVRIGTADIYNVCAQFVELEDYVAFSRPSGKDEEVVLCLKLTNPAGATDATIAELSRRLRSELRAQTSPRHVPAVIYLVGDVPYTANGKRVEGAARAAAVGDKIANLSSLANPEALDDFGSLMKATKW